MKSTEQKKGCDCGCNRRQFIAATGTAAAGMFSLPMIKLFDSVFEPPKLSTKEGAIVKTVFFYPPSETFSKPPDGWWSWPGNTYDAEGHQRKYSEEIRKISSKLNMKVNINDKSVSNNEDAQKIVKEVELEKPDGLLLIMFYNNSLAQVDIVLEAAEKLGIPTVFYIGLGVKHGSIRNYQRPGIYFIQSLDNFEAIESGMRMINARKLLKQSVLLSIDNTKGRTESVEKFFGITTRPMLVDTYNKEFNSVIINNKAVEFLNKLKKESIEIRNVSQESFEYAVKAYFALKNLIEKENADAVTMNCLRVGLGRPCIGFSKLNNQLIPAICENDINAAYGQMIGQAVTGRPGFQHNPAYETEKNHYYASHCTCPTKMYGPDGNELKYLLTRYFHTNDGTCCIQVFWNPGDPVTMIHYYPGENPKLDVYSGIVVVSHQMPPAGGCSTNVEIEITNRTNATSVTGHHNLLFCGDFTKRFKDFAQLHKLQLSEPLI